MKLLSLFVISMASILLITSCTAKKSESTLLSDPKACAEEDCPTPQSSIDGDLIISPDAGAYQMNVDKSDIIEIAGKCSDLGFRANKILVEVYEGEDTSIPAGPYINNATSSNCTNSSVPANNGQKCFWITDGKGAVVTDAMGVPILEFPQCYNGKFSFSVRLGKILRDNPTGQSDDSTNPRKKYLVRFKLRVDDPIRESAWNSAVVERGLTKPTFSQTTDSSTKQCKIFIDAYKNIGTLTDISYGANLERGYINNVTSASEFLFPYFTQRPAAAPVGTPALGGNFYLDYISNITAGWSIREFDIFNKDDDGSLPGLIIPGVRHKIKVTAYDRKYSYPGMTPLTPVTTGVGLTTEESTSETLECDYQTPVVSGTRQNGDVNGNVSGCVTSNKVCSFSVVDFPINMPGRLQWAVYKNKTSYAPDFEPTGAVLTCSGLVGSTAAEGCLNNLVGVSLPGGSSFQFKPEQYPRNSCASASDNTYDGQYGVAVRYISPFGEKGEWSSIVNCLFD